MAYLLVGMGQGAVLPRPCTAYEGILTHGIDSCTGVAMVSAQHVFLAHIPPPPNLVEKDTESVAKQQAWYLGGRKLIEDGIHKMSGDITSVIIISPNTEEELPNKGPRLLQDRFEVFFKNSIKCDVQRKLGSAVSVNCKTGDVKEKMGTFSKSEFVEKTQTGGGAFVLIN
ncbi:MAG: hypothetical protein WDN69_19095 [Aliidongia sp.]